NADARLQLDPSGNLHNTDTVRDRASDETAPSARFSAQRSSTTISLPSCPGAGYELIEGHRCASTAGFVEPFNFAAVRARQPTSRARVLEVRIQSPPPASQLRTWLPRSGCLTVLVPADRAGALRQSSASSTRQKSRAAGMDRTIDRRKSPRTL